MSDVSVRPPKQKRSQESLERVLDASTRLLEENGFDAFTIQDVSQRAEVSVGAIYARFGNKESLLRAVHRHAMESIGAEHGAVAAADGRPDEPVRDVIARAVKAVAAIFRGNEELLRAFMHLGAVDDEIARRGSDRSIHARLRAEPVRRAGGIPTVAVRPQSSRRRERGRAGAAASWRSRAPGSPRKRPWSPR